MNQYLVSGVHRRKQSLGTCGHNLLSVTSFFPNEKGKLPRDIQWTAKTNNQLHYSRSTIHTKITMYLKYYSPVITKPGMVLCSNQPRLTVNKVTHYLKTLIFSKSILSFE